MGIGEGGSGGIWRVAPVEYEDPNLSSELFWDTTTPRPLYPKVK